MQSSIGLDIGSHHVRALALRSGKGGPTVVGHASVARRNEDGTERSLTTVLAEVHEKLSIPSPYAVASSEIEAMPRFIQVAPLPPDRLQRLLRLELAPDDGQPFPAMDALALSSEGDDINYLGLVADSAVVKLFQAELGKAKIHPQTISWGPIALAAAAHQLELPDQQMALVIDIGANGTDVALIGSGRLYACRRLGLGGEMFTLALVDAGLTPQRAERSKIAGDYQRPVPGQLPSATPDATVERTGELDFALDDGVVESIAAPGEATVAMATTTLGPQLTRAAETLYSQLATTLAFFKAQLKRKDLAISQVFLCGGGSALIGLPEYLGRRFQVPTTQWDPFTGLAGKAPEEPAQWARAYGLALAGCADVPRIDLRPESDLRRELWRRRLIWPFVAAACMLIAGAIVVMGFSSQVDRDSGEISRLDHAVKEHKRLTGDLTKLKEERLALSEDLRAIAARVYAARDVLYTLRALKELAGPAHQQIWVTELTTKEVGKDDVEGAPMTGPAPPTRLSVAPRTPQSESLISRGGVRITCRVKTDTVKTAPERDDIRRKYRDELRQWKSPDGSLLYSEVLDADVSERTKIKHSLEKIPEDEFVFALYCKFPETSLASLGGALQAEANHGP
ncbi:MAG: hypothetical protein AAB263_11035 [Planctomycetota bacterium]